MSSPVMGGKEREMKLEFKIEVEIAYRVGHFANESAIQNFEPHSYESLEDAVEMLMIARKTKPGFPWIIYLDTEFKRRA